MQVTKGTWRMCEQCVPGSLSSSPAREPGNKARCGLVIYHDNVYIVKCYKVGFQRICNWCQLRSIKLCHIHTTCIQSEVK